MKIRVGKMPMELDVQQRIRRGTYQNVGIGQHTGDKTAGSGAAGLGFVGNRQGNATAEQALGERVQIRCPG